MPLPNEQLTQGSLELRNRFIGKPLHGIAMSALDYEWSVRGRGCLGLIHYRFALDDHALNLGYYRSRMLSPHVVRDSDPWTRKIPVVVMISPQALGRS